MTIKLRYRKKFSNLAVKLLILTSKLSEHHKRVMRQIMTQYLEITTK
jgi:hypothetical protein